MNIGFEKWCEKLLDTGKGNRLINFKESNARTMQIILPDVNFIFEKLSSGTTLSFFDIDSFEKTNKIDWNKFESQEDINSYIFKHLGNNQVFAYKKGFSTKSVLGKLQKTAYDYLIEKGINILYVSFGFLNWKDKNGDSLKSPLILVPISIEKKYTNSSISMKEYDDEVTTNPTLIYKMKMELGIDFPEFRQSEFSEESIRDYFSRLTETLKQFDWSVEETIQIGLFSFLKLNMYRDLKENENDILENPLVKRLLNQSESDLEDKKYDIKDSNNIDETLLETSLHNVVDCDSSQMIAIMNAKLGNSFVLQGPPGTGKSQTITNLIAEFLYDNKKILFVSEKLAALKVVYNNLKKAELADFCLELHSEKTNKREFLTELHNALSRDKVYLDKETINYSKSELKKAEELLDRYVNSIHTKVSHIDKTPFEIMGEITKYRNAEKLDCIFPNLSEKGKDFYENSINLLERYRRSIDDVGYDYHENSWYGFAKTDISYEEKIKLKQKFENCIDILKKSKEKLDEFEKISGIYLFSVESIKNNIDFLKQIQKQKFFDENIFSSENLKNLIQSLDVYNDHLKQLKNYENQLFKVFSNDILKNDINRLYLSYENDYKNFFRFLNKRYKTDKELINKYKIIAKNLGYKETLKYLEIARKVNNLRNILVEDEENIYSNLIQDSKNKYDWNEVQTELIELQKYENLFTDNLKNVRKDNFLYIKQQINDLFNIFNQIDKLELNIIQEYFDVKIIDFNSLDFNIIIEKLNGCIEKYDELENWLRFLLCLNELKKYDLVEFVDEFINQGYDRNNLINIFSFNFYMQWLHLIIKNDTVLSNFSRQIQDMAVENFITNDTNKFEISRAEIISKLSSSMPDLNMMSAGGQIVNIEREYHKKIRQKPIRILLKESTKLIQTLKPCFLMSPLSVSTFLEYGVCEFDVVIFDEASQIFPWDAIGAIARAKQVIIVGDSKQLSPTDFFSSNISSDENYYEDEVSEDALDFESILDLGAATFNQNRLNWHYRSKTEDLIAFSNYNFYNNSLVTFPSSKKDNPGMGISFYYVQDGIFSRKTKSNKIEAEKVVDLVFEHFEKNPNMSLGVVAFSISQQAEIENLISKRRENNSKYDNFFDNDRNEPFFIKNLETVQGDERDVIIFSIAYAKGDDGKFIHNFGPLNQKGGERRLNVAISRAKYNIKVVSSIKGNDIDLKKTNSIGARMLKEYLDMAEMGVKNWTELKDINKQSSISNSTIELENEICEIIKSKGFCVETNVGSSEFKIDICVKHPTRQDFVVAIECDGPNYKSGKTTRDRDRLRKEVLEKLGWKFYRIWSLDWILNKKFEKNRLINFIEKSITEFDDMNQKMQNNNNSNEISQILTENDKKNDKKNFIIEEKFEKKDLKSLFKVYEEYNLNSKDNFKFDDVIFDIVKTEAPITEHYLLKKTAVLFGREKVTSAVRELFFEHMEKFKNKIFKIQDFYVVDKNMMIELRVPKENSIPRDIMMISNMELASGLYQIINSSFGITEKGLFNTIVGLLGFSKVGTNIQLKLEESLKIILEKNLVKLVDGLYYKV